MLDHGLIRGDMPGQDHRLNGQVKNRGKRARDQSGINHDFSRGPTILFSLQDHII